MKKLLLSLTVALSAITVNAQNCSADPMYTLPGVYPDSATGLPDAYVGVPYNETITAVTPADTCVQVLPAPLPCTNTPIDSVVVDSVYGLPPGFTVVSENENSLPFYFYGGTSSCMLISGTAQPGDEGVYPLYVSGLSWGQLAGVPTSQPFIVDWYQIEIVTPTGINDFAKKEFEVLQNSPNPVKTTSNIEYYMPKSDVVNIQVRNVLGELISSENINSTTGTNRYLLDASLFSNGIYFYQFSYNNKVISKKFIVNK